MTMRSELRVLVLIGLAAFFVRAAPLLRAGSSWALTNDSDEYIELADGIRSGCGFALRVHNSCTNPELFRTPGYPAFLAAMRETRVALLVQAVIGATTCFILGLLALNVWGVTAAVAAELLLALDIPSISLGAVIMSECLFQALLTLAVALELVIIWRASGDRRAIWMTIFAGSLFGAASLVRPNGLIMIVITPFPWLTFPKISWKRRVTGSLCALAVPVVIGLAWTIRNRVQGGIWTFSTVAEYNLLFYRAAGVLQYRSAEPLRVVEECLDRELPSSILDRPGLITAGLAREITKRALRIICSDPVAFLITYVRSLIWVMFAPDREDLNRLLRTPGGSASMLSAFEKPILRLKELLRSPTLTFLVATQIIQLMFMWCGAARALWSVPSEPTPGAIMIVFQLCVIACMLLVVAGPEGYGRFRMPIDPILAMLAGVGWFGHIRSCTHQVIQCELAGCDCR